MTCGYRIVNNHNGRKKSCAVIVLQMNIWKMIHLNCGERYEDLIDRRNICEAWKKSQAAGIRTHDLGDTGLGSWECYVYEDRKARTRLAVERQETLASQRQVAFV